MPAFIAAGAGGWALAPLDPADVPPMPAPGKVSACPLLFAMICCCEGAQPLAVLIPPGGADIGIICCGGCGGGIDRPGFICGGWLDADGTVPGIMPGFPRDIELIR